jgi:FkbM family methyltransferase
MKIYLIRIKNFFLFLLIKVVNNINTISKIKILEFLINIEFFQFDRSILKNKKNIIFDIGAGKGQSIIRFLKNFPNSIIYSFEPHLDSFNFIKKKFNKDNVRLYNIGIGSINSTQKLHTYNHSGVNSFFKLNYKIKRTVNENIFFKKKFSVRVMTLDNFVYKNKIKRIDYLKIDTQGSEVNILRGARGCLKKKIIKFIEVEIIFSKIYPIKSNFFHIEKILLPYGYRLFHIKDIYYSHKDLKICQVDAIYKIEE